MYFKAYAAEAAALLKGKTDVGVVGGFRTIADIEEALESTDLAFISMSRPFLRQTCRTAGNRAIRNRPCAFPVPAASVPKT